MAIITVVEILVSFLQNMGLIGQVTVEWPASFTNVREIVKYFSIDFTFPFEGLNIPPLDYRSQHIILTNLFPLFITLILLIFFKTVAVVTWYSLLLSSIGVLFAGLTLRFIPLPSEFSSQISLAEYLIIAGGSGLGVMLLSWLIYRAFQRRQFIEKWSMFRKIVKKTAKINPEDEIIASQSLANSLERSQSIDEEKPNILALKKEDPFKPKPWYKMLRNSCLSVCLVILGFLCIGTIEVTSFKEYFLGSSDVVDDVQLFVSEVGKSWGIVFLVLGSLLGYNFLMNSSRAGRQVNTKVNAFIRSNVIKFSLLLLTLLYIPITTSLLNSVSCVSMTCPTGTEFPVRSYDLTDASSILSQFSASVYNSTTACSNCNFNSTTCPIADKLCPVVSDSRLNKDLSISCAAEIYPFYLPGSILMFMSLTLGVPYCFYKLTRICVKFLNEIPSKGNVNIKWRNRADLSENSCKSLYAMFEYQWRYYKLMMLIYKLITVAIFVFAKKFPSSLVLSLAVVHFVFFFISVMSRPFTSVAEDTMSTLCIGLNGINATVTFIIGLGVYVPNVAVTILVVINLGLPPVALLAGVYIMWQREKRGQALKKKMEKEGSIAVKSTEDLAEDMRIKEFTKRLDEELNKKLLHVVVNSFLFMGVTAFLAICVSSIGVMQSSSAATVLGYKGAPRRLTTAESIIQFEFGGYKSWNEFTSNCCCEAHHSLVDSNSTSRIIEMWKCLPREDTTGLKITKSFIYKQKLRSDPILGGGFDIRGYCSNTFKAGCGLPTYQTTSKTVDVRCNGVSYHQLW